MSEKISKTTKGQNNMKLLMLGWPKNQNKQKQFTAKCHIEETFLS